MSANRTLRRTVAVLATATAAVLAALVPAAAAQAADDDVRVSVSNLPSSMTAGQTHSFSVRFQNHASDKQAIDAPRAAIVIRLDGLQPDAVHVTLRGGELPKTTDGANVVFTDLQPLTLQLRDGRTVSRTYSIKFDPSAPSGQADVTAIALDSANNQRGSGSDSTNVRGGAAQATPTPRPSHTPSPSPSPPPAVTVPIQSGTPASLAPLDNKDASALAADSSGGAPVLVYVLGGVLMLIGATILWLLFRKPKAEGAAVAGDFDPNGPPTLGYPAGGPHAGGPRAAAPTAMLPVISDARTTTMQPTRPGPIGPRPGPGAMATGPMPGPGLGGPRRDPRPTAENPRVAGRPHQPVDPWAATADIDDTVAGR